MKIYLNFSNPLYVSSGYDPDKIKFVVRNPYVFQSLTTNVTIKMNYTDSANMPSLAKSDEEAAMIMNIGSSTKDSMMLTLVIPFIFMIFMTLSMNRVWSLYLML